MAHIGLQVNIDKANSRMTLHGKWYIGANQRSAISTLVYCILYMYIYTVSQKTVPTYLLLCVGQI